MDFKGSFECGNGERCDTFTVTDAFSRFVLHCQAIENLGYEEVDRICDVLMKKYVHPLYAIRDRVRGYEVSAMKSAMEILGMPAGPVRPPLQNTAPRDVEDVLKLMRVYSHVLDEREAGYLAERSSVGAGRV